VRIGVISDTHGNIAAFDKALAYFDGADLIIHAGDVLYHPPRLGWMEGYDVPAFVGRLNGLDVPVVIAQGNCDAQVYEELLDMPVQSPYAIVEFEGVCIVANHGHLLNKQQMIDTAHRYKADYFISGHTHIPVLENVDGVTLMNPGSPAIPKYEIDGQPVPSVGLITDESARIININDGSTLIELPRRSSSL
jgi:putative phosphoesterase